MKKNSYIKIQDAKNLVKDPTTKAILEIDSEALNAYKRKRSQEERIQSALDDLDNLKKQFSEIKNMIGELIVLSKKGI